MDEPKVGDQVITPDYGAGRVVEVRHPGEHEFDNLIYFDDGMQPLEPVLAVRTAQHR